MYSGTVIYLIYPGSTYRNEMFVNGRLAGLLLVEFARTSCCYADAKIIGNGESWRAFITRTPIIQSVPWQGIAPVVDSARKSGKRSSHKRTPYSTLFSSRREVSFFLQQTVSAYLGVPISHHCDVYCSNDLYVRR